MGTVVSSKTANTPQRGKKAAVAGGNIAEQNRRQYADCVVKEETGRVVNYLKEQLPQDGTIRIEGKGGLREKIGACISRNVYTVIDNYKVQSSAIQYTLAGERNGKHLETADITAMVTAAGETATPLNASEPYKPLHSRPFVIHELETYANSILKRKSGADTVRETEACSVVRCVFRDNKQKPQTVTELTLTVNVDEHALLGLFVVNIAAYIIGSRIIASINTVIASVKENDSSHVVSVPDIEAAVNVLAGGDVTTEEISALLIEETGGNAKTEQIRDGGFAIASAALLAILRSAKLDYRFAERQKSCRELVILEYADTDAEDGAALPDERYGIRLRYLDGKTLAAERKTHTDRFSRFTNNITQLRDLLAVLYEDSKPVFRVTDFDDLAKKNKNRMQESAGSGDSDGSSADMADMFLLDVAGSHHIKMKEIRAYLVKMRERLRNIDDFLNPAERDIAEQRLTLLEGEYTHFDRTVDPHDLDCGLVIDMDITSIKRRKTTLTIMAVVLGDFLESAPEYFKEAAERVFNQ